MIKVKFKPCVECVKQGDERDKAMANNSLSLCLYHNNKRKGSKKGLTTAKHGQGQGYMKMYMEIWNERPHVSEISGLPIKEFNVSCFMHTLNKNTYKALRHDKRNVFLVLESEHHQYDNVGREALKKDGRWNKVFDRRIELLRELYLPNGKNA